jgi:DNA-binding NarL/FixJ family response regulator
MNIQIAKSLPDNRSMTDFQTKIIIVDDHPLVRQGMRKLIVKERDLAVIHEAGSGDEALRLITEEAPDLAIVDISLESESSGLDLIEDILARFKSVVILVLSMHEESFYAERAFRAGAHGYITKKEAPLKIVEAIHTVMSGKNYLSPSFPASILDHFVTGTFPGE